MAQTSYQVSIAGAGTAGYNAKKKGTGYYADMTDNDWQDIIGTMPSITPEQGGVSTPLSEYLSGILSGQPSEGYTNMQGMYSQALEDYYQEAIYKPAMSEFQDEIIPTIKENYVATGAITGTEVADKIAKESTKLQQNLIGTKATLAYQDYMARNPGTSDLLQAALAYLNIPMMGVYQKPEEEAAKKKPTWGSTISPGTNTANINFNQATGNNVAKPVADDIIGGGWDYWKGKHPTIGEAYAQMINSG